MGIRGFEPRSSGIPEESQDIFQEIFFTQT